MAYLLKKKSSADFFGAETKMGTAGAEDALVEEETIKWINIIFLPFQLWWQIIMISVVCVKCFMSPFLAVFPFDCAAEEHRGIVLILKFFMDYLCDPLYLFDTFLYIVHRQVADEAMKREFTPKTAFQLLLDILSVLPFFSIFADDACAPLQLWPHVTKFNGITLLYRIVNFFALNTSHSYWKLIFGYAILYVLVMNAATCLFLLWTYDGFCARCTTGPNFFDWRANLVIKRKRKTFDDHVLYYYALNFIQSFFMNHAFEESQILPFTYVETGIAIVLMITGRLFIIFVIIPKMFCEGILRLKKVYEFYPRVKRIIEDTKIRNPDVPSYKNVEKCYRTIWTKRDGMTDIPNTIYDLPRYMRLSIQQDLVWAVFYHSPCLRKTSHAFKRWLGQYVQLSFRQRGERFFSGEHCHTNLYYIKSGTVQFVSSDDSTSSLISVTSGTLLGDISFFVPPLNRKVIVHCLTYCEVFSISRMSLLKCLHKFPEDRRLILRLARERLKHARKLFRCKESIRGLDRSDDEGIAWIKQRWWQINDVVISFKTNVNTRRKCEIPPEDSTFHCAKFIGQLVLSKDDGLQAKTIFLKSDFPWILDPHSKFCKIWRHIVKGAVFIALILIPPFMVPIEKTLTWFVYTKFVIDIVYIIDVILGLITAVDSSEDTDLTTVSVMLQRFKSKYFLLDVLSTALLDPVSSMLCSGHFLTLTRYNRLLKTYLLFGDPYRRTWYKDLNPMAAVYYSIFLVKFCVYYIMPYIVYFLTKLYPGVFTEKYMIGNICLNATYCPNKEGLIDPSYGTLSILLGWTAQLYLGIYDSVTMTDVIYGNITGIFRIIFHLFMQVKLSTALYLKYHDRMNYQIFVTSLKNHYKRLKLHPDLMKRLGKFLDCHWMHFRGMDIMHPDLLKDEPYEIYWRHHGERAEKLIGESKVFVRASLSLVRDLAKSATFLVLPKGTTIVSFGARMENVMWQSRGVIQCEFNDDKSVVSKVFLKSSEIIEVTAVFFDRIPIRTDIAASDVEILYIAAPKFFEILKRHPLDNDNIIAATKEIQPNFDKLFISYLRKHRGYQKRVRERVFQGKPPTGDTSAQNELPIPDFLRDIRRNPESILMLIWQFLRAVTVSVQLWALTKAGVSLPGTRELFEPYLNVFNVLTAVDIGIKLFQPYYDHRGLVISKYYKCCMNYLSKTFFVDLLSLLVVWRQMVIALLAIRDNIQAWYIAAFCKYLLLYQVIGFFNYWAHRPSVNTIFLVILKWQVVVVLIASLGAFLLLNLCILFRYDERGHLTEILISWSCWIPFHIDVQWKYYYAFCLHAVQGSLMDSILGHIEFKYYPVKMIVYHVVFMIVFWFIKCQIQALLVLSYQGETAFRHGIVQLKNFLQGERVGKTVIEKSINHFAYWFKRTAGVNMRIFNNERVGVIFKQDLNFFFYNFTFGAVGDLLGGGDELQRMLATFVAESYFLPGEDIAREMDLTPNVFLVHRGKIAVYRNGEKITVMNKGSIFGQLDSATPRPLRMTATAQTHADVLAIPLQTFHDIINEDVRKNIAKEADSKFDYISIKKTVEENPYKTLAYILRGTKVIKFPGMSEPLVAEDNIWYQRWLLLVWVVGPVITSALVLLILFVPYVNTILYTLIFFDILQLIHFSSEFFTMEFFVSKKYCKYIYIRWKRFTMISFYVDVFALVVPIISFFLKANSRYYHLPRILRLYTTYNYHRDFCESLQSKSMSIILKSVSMLLLIHTLTCLWMGFNCIEKAGKPIEMFQVPTPPEIKVHIDETQWGEPNSRADKHFRRGCMRQTPEFLNIHNRFMNDTKIFTLLVPNDWEADYLVALTFITTLYTNMDINYVPLITDAHLNFKIIAAHLLFMIQMWITSIAISLTYTKLRDMYHFDYDVGRLLHYLRNNGVSHYLQLSVKAYTKLLWQRQKGNWLPEITHQAPLCLREDILSSLYMHHLITPQLFSRLPVYFLRQLAVRLKRVVVFPGKSIVIAGDIDPIVYFIHEGEVEKWHADTNGDTKMVSLLTINGYFGLVSGLFPDTPYSFTYVTRTVVDLVYLRHGDWQDLLNGYPEIRKKLYTAAAGLNKRQK